MRSKKLLYAGAALLAVYALAGFFAAPAVVKPRLISALEQSTGRSVTLGALRINPFTFSLTVEDFRLLDRDSSLLVSFKELYIRYQITSVFRHAWALAQLHLDTPYVAVRILHDGRLSVGDLLTLSSCPVHACDSAALTLRSRQGVAREIVTAPWPKS